MWLQLVGMLLVAAGVAALVQDLWPRPDSMKAISQRILEGGGSFATAFVFVVLVGPLVEELFFRGLVLHGFLRRYRLGTAIGSSALLFAAVHLNPWQFAPVLVAGLMLGLWRAESGSLWPCVVGHSVMNAIPVLLHETRRAHGGPPMDAPTSASRILALCAGGAILFAGGLRLMVRSRGRADGPRNAPVTPPKPS